MQRWQLEIVKFKLPHPLVCQDRHYMEIGSKTMEDFNINHDNKRRQKEFSPTNHHALEGVDNDRFMFGWYTVTRIMLWINVFLGGFAKAAH